EIQEILAKSPIENAEEFAIHDYDGFDNVSLSEHESIETVVELAFFITEHGELGAALLGDYSVEEAGRLLQENYYGAYESEVDFAYEVIEEYYSNALPENLMFYFDYVAFTRDLFINDYFSIEASHKVHVFSNF